MGHAVAYALCATSRRLELSRELRLDGRRLILCPQRIPDRITTNEAIHARQPAFDWRLLYARAFRVLPAYLMVLLFYFAIPWFREAPGLSPAWQFLTFTENFRIDYLHDQAFSHVWSLCVEEHFYLVLPLLIFLLMRRPGFSKTIAVILGILCFGIAIRAYVYLHYVAIFPREDDAFALAYVWQRSRPSAPPGGNAPCPTATYCSWEDSRSADAPCGFSTTVSHFQAALWVSRCWPLALAC
jgi:hypothetical protein